MSFSFAPGVPYNRLGNDLPKSQWRWAMRVSLIAILILLLGTVIWILPKLLSPFPLSEQWGINYPLLYPKYLPAGYAVDPTSFQKKDKVVIFNITTPVNRNIAVSEEAIPAGINLSAPSNASDVLNIPNSPHLSFNTSAGPAYADLWGDKYVCSIVAANTWIILNVTGFTSHQVQVVAQAFTK